MKTQYHVPPSVFEEKPALLHAKPKRSYNPLHYVWVGWEQFAYFFAPANGCQYCWTLRMFLVGLILGIELMYWFPNIKFW